MKVILIPKEYLGKISALPIFGYPEAIYDKGTPSNHEVTKEVTSQRQD